MEICWTDRTSFDDHGHRVPGDHLKPGQVYQYRLRAHTDDGGFSGYTDIEQGHPYEVLPPTDVTAERSEDGQEVTVTWTDPNDFTLENLTHTRYRIYEAEADAPGSFREVHTFTLDGGVFQQSHRETVTVLSESPGVALLYKVGVSLRYNAIWATGNHAGG